MTLIWKDQPDETTNLLCTGEKLVLTKIQTANFSFGSLKKGLTTLVDASTIYPLRYTAIFNNTLLAQTAAIDENGKPKDDQEIIKILEDFYNNGKSALLKEKSEIVTQDTATDSIPVDATEVATPPELV